MVQGTEAPHSTFLTCDSDCHLGKQFQEQEVRLAVLAVRLITRIALRQQALSASQPSLAVEERRAVEELTIRMPAQVIPMM
jgi:hypothetical protein